MTLIKMLRIMRMTACIMLGAVLHISAAGVSQTVSFSGKNVSLEKVFTEVKKQTGFVFFYDEDMLKDAKPVSIEATSLPLEPFLDLLLKDQPLKYSIKNKAIIISRKPPVVEEKQHTESAYQMTAEPIHGVLKDEEGNPLVGITITLKGKQKTTITDKEGKFTIAAEIGDVLIFTSVEVETTQFRVTSTAQTKGIFLSLTKKVTPLNQVVVNKGYYSQRQMENTGNVFVVSGADIQKQPVSDPLLALQGRVPGLYIQQTSGVPGAYSTIRLRGQNSIYSPDTKLETVNDPLFIIDGVPFSTQTLSDKSYGTGVLGSYFNTTIPNYVGGGLSPFNNLNPADIEKIEILKDADATAIYGVRGGNGVILITTKRGRPGTTKVEFNASHGATKVMRELPLMNTQQYLAMRREAFKNDGLTPGSGDFDLNGAWDTTRYTDWQKVLIGNTAEVTNAQLGISGGSDNTHFYINAGYNNQGTQFPGDFRDRKLSTLMSITHSSVNGRFSLGASMAYSNDDNNLPSNNPASMIGLAPNAPAIYDANGNLNWQVVNGNPTFFYNPLGKYIYEKVNARTNTLIGNINLNYEILKGLHAGVSMGYTKSMLDQTTIIPISYLYYPLNTYTTSRQLRLSKSSGETWLIEPKLNYSLPFGKHKIEVDAGGTIQQEKRNGLATTSSGYTDDVLIPNPRAATSIQLDGFEVSLVKLFGAYARVGYNYDSKYIINITGRRDGNSKFGESSRYSNFASIGAGWLFSKESFVQKSLPWLSFGKLRGSYGTTGNGNLLDYQYISTYGIVNTTYQGYTALNPLRIPNPYYRWEVVRKLEGGLELGLLNDKITLNFSYYRNRTIDQLIGIPLPTITGFSTVQGNLPAVIQNSGFEFWTRIEAVKSKGFNWVISGNFTLPRTKLVSFPGLQTDKAFNSFKGQYIVGQSLSLMRVSEYTGVDPKTGLYTFKSQKGTIPPQTGVVNGRLIDGTFVDLSQKWFGGLENSFSYKGFYLSIFLQFAKQLQPGYIGVFGMPGRFDVFRYPLMQNQPSYLVNEWKSIGDNAQFQKFNTDFTGYASSNAMQRSDANIFDASYIRLKSVSLSYQLPQAWQQKVHLKNAQIYVKCENLYTLTRYPAFDPETSINIPPVMTITAGMQITL